MHSSLFAAGFSLVLCLFFVFVFCFQKCKSFARPEDSEMRVNLNFIRHYCFDDRKLNHYLILLLKSCAVDLPKKKFTEIQRESMDGICVVYFLSVPA